jgi:hypothetical protein
LSDSWPVNGCRGAAALLLAGMLAGQASAAESPCLDGAIDIRAGEALDARSLTLDDGRVLRVAGIEPFDLLLPDAEDAEARLRQRLSQLVSARPLSVQLAAEKADRYGRHPALIAANGLLVQESLAREGLAIAFASGDPLPCFDRVLAAEEAARHAGRGFWAGATLPDARPEALGAWVGRFVIFEGKVVSVGNRSTRTYLNFGGRWSEDVTVEIEAGDRKRFGGEASLSALAGRLVRVRGFLQAKAGPMMAVRSPMQVEVLDAEPGKKGNAS